jgi:hypothetical protein
MTGVREAERTKSEKKKEVENEGTQQRGQKINEEHVFLAHLLYLICNKCICPISTGSWMSYAHWRISYSFFSVRLGVILILVLGFYSGLSGRVRTVYLLSLCLASLLSSRFTASALVWFSNFLKYLVLHFFISLSTVFICRSSWIL